MQNPPITIIAALTSTGVIGKNKQLPWKIPDDLKNFKKLTTGNTVIMGRKTFESIGNHLPNRHNIVVSSSMHQVPSIEIAHTIQEAIEKARARGKEAFIIGGATLYEQCLPFADKLILSHIKNEYEGDTYFPKFNLSDWRIESKQDFTEFEVVVYKRNK